MAARRTRIILSIPWDDEDQGHPAQWGYDVMLGVHDGLSSDAGVIVLDWEEVEPEEEQPV